MLDQITPLILTYNESENIARTLDQLRWARDIVVVDSFSNDDTEQILSRYPQVRMFKRTFDNFAAQCNYGLDRGVSEKGWVLNLDADYVLTDELIEELKTLSPDPSIAGYRARFIYCIGGRQIRSGIYPPVTVLFRKGKGRFIVDGHAHRVVIEGNIRDLQSPILHDDRKPLRRWFTSQVRYTELEARKLREISPADLSLTDRIRRWRVLAPPAMLFYCLVLRGGVLDGWRGFYYAFQRVLAELMLALYLFESKVDDAVVSASIPAAAEIEDTSKPLGAQP